MRIFGLLLLGAAGVLPAAEFSTFVGDTNQWQLSSLAVDAAGNTWLAGGRTFNLSYNPLQPQLATEAVVVKLDPAGNRTLFLNLAGKGNDGARAVAVDGAGNIYMGGQTSSPDFPLRNPLFPALPTPGFGGAGFLAKFSPDGSQLIYSTYFPAPIVGIAVDAAGNAYVTGTAYAPNFPNTTKLPNSALGGLAPMIYGAFVTKISPVGDRIVYSTVISGGNEPCGCCSSCFTSARGAGGVAVAVDSAGNAYLTGNTNTTDLPTTTGALQATGIGAFVAKINPAGTGLVYLTYLGAGMQVIQPYLATATGASALAVDASGNAYVVGSTWDPGLPVTTGAFQLKFNGWSQIDNYAPEPPTDAYAFKLNPSGTTALWGSYLGGAGADAATAAAVDASGDLWVAGTTRSTDFPDAQGWSTGGDFVVEFNPAGTALPYSGRYPGGTVSPLFALDSAGLLHVASASGVASAVAASARPAARPWTVANAASNAAGGQVVPGEVISIYGPHIGPYPPVQATPVGGVMPNMVSNVQVFFDNYAAPLLYGADGQINAVVPYEIEGQATVGIKVVNEESAGPVFTAAVLAADGHVFRNSDGSAAALNQDGTLNSQTNPAAPGSVVAMWATGIGYLPFVAYGLSDGQIATAAQQYYGCCQIYVAGNTLNEPYQGAAPGLVAGIVQINVQLPATAAGSTVLEMPQGYTSLDSVSIYVK